MRLLAVMVVLAGLLTGCAGRQERSLLDGDTIVTGVRTDLPGLGFRRPDGTFEGFDIDVARYIAHSLGKKIRFVPALSGDRIGLITNGQADMVLATLSVTPERKTEIGFAGPYYASYQDILVRSAERARTVRDLKGRRFCGVKGSDPVKRMLAVHGMTATVTEVPDYGRCMQLIRAGTVDAITTNDVILAGLIRQAGGGFRLVNTRISEQNTGIGIRRGDLDGCEALNRAITRMYQDGTAARLVGKWFKGTGLDVSTVEIPQFEGCL
ncbi:transporter substrate-binding domain-containing protein [Actinomadura roseirufa]|uniref:transporter substrate-binding domain-containing protein n=1 Tax=Actinomadura roseirufa TaxID=2094049 RepID=UPI00104166EE|nr:transporter substrate-binding domain-containing protein [Actinomadura roseirufa]